MEEEQQEQEPNNKKKGGGALWGAAGIATVGALKSKGALLGLAKFGGLLKLGWLLKSALSMFLFFGVYWVRFGWQFALGILVSLIAHEGGHYIYMKSKGLEPELPIFIPFVGAYVKMTKMPADKATHAWTAFAGPFAGTLLAGIFFCFGMYFNNDLLIALGHFGFFLNLLQLIPMKPLDGGFIAECVSKWLFIPGVGIAFMASMWLHSFLLMIISAIGFISALKALMHKPSPAPQTAQMRAMHEHRDSQPLVVYEGNETPRVAPSAGNQLEPEEMQEASTTDKILVGASYVGLLLTLGVCFWLSSAQTMH